MSSELPPAQIVVEGKPPRWRRAWWPIAREAMMRDDLILAPTSFFTIGIALAITCHVTGGMSRQDEEHVLSLLFAAVVTTLMLVVRVLRAWRADR